MYQQPIVIVKPADAPVDRYEPLLAAFTSQRVCTSGANAMQAIESSPARLVVIESALEDMDGADLAEMIRDVDEEADRFTYIILVGDEMTPEISEAHGAEIDAFVSRDRLDTLPAVATAGARLSQGMNEIILHKVQLEREREILLDGQLLDPLTGLGNHKMAMLTLEDSIAQIESRGGAVCVLLISVDNRDALIEQYDNKIADELMQAIAERLNSLVRPMDTVTYFEDGLFALILVQPSVEHCTAECYQRIFDGIRLKSYRTSVGYLETDIAMSICASHAENGPPLPDRMVRTAREGLSNASKTQQINVTLLTEVE